MFEWSDRDRRLAQALSDYEADVHSCGHHLADSTDSMRSTWYEAKSMVCGACAAVDRWKKENKDPSPGTLVYAVDTYEG